jgi:hypothetical protein
MSGAVVDKWTGEVYKPKSRMAQALLVKGFYDEAPVVASIFVFIGMIIGAVIGMILAILFGWVF